MNACLRHAQRSVTATAIANVTDRHETTYIGMKQHRQAWNNICHSKASEAGCSARASKPSSIETKLWNNSFEVYTRKILN